MNSKPETLDDFFELGDKEIEKSPRLRKFVNDGLRNETQCSRCKQKEPHHTDEGGSE